MEENISYSDKHFIVQIRLNVVFAQFVRELPHLSTAMAAIEYIDENMAVMGKKFWNRQ